MCLALRHHKAHPPHPRLADWEPTVYYGAGRRRASFHTSSTEIGHLALALALLTAVFGLFLGGIRWKAQGLVRDGGLYEAGTPIGDVFVISAIAVGSGFLLHELMHKFVAQRYGHWAEFRAQLFGLLLPIPLVLLMGMIFAAPGAVVISGMVRRNENGIISAAGPGTNIAIALVAFPFTSTAGGTQPFGAQLAMTVMLVNAVLAVFNMIPLGPLDGKKVWRWQPLLWVAIVAAGIGTLILALGRAGFLLA